LIELIGEGGFGRVYKARQYKLDRLVAVKVIATDDQVGPTGAKRFEAEAVAIARLHHPNIVQAFDFGTSGARMYLAMELLDGKDLGYRIRERGAIDERTTWQLIRQAAAGLAHAAAQGVVHRDVKPANLFLTDAPIGSDLLPGVPAVKVTDFGLALAKWADTPSDRLTSTGMAIGTPSYMAPEQWRGEAVDHRADIYALGATAYHALSGRPPFEGRTIWDVVARKIEHTPLPLPPLLEASAALITKMMDPDPQRRVQTYAELIDRIDRLPIFGGLQRKSGVRPFWKSRRGIAVVAVILLVVMALTVAVFRSSGSRSSQTPLARYESDGNQDALFDGVSLDRWIPIGAWSVEADEEDTSVLSGAGLIRRRFVGYPDYRLIVGLDVYESSAAEVHFAIPSDPTFARRLVLRVTRDNGAMFGTRDGDRGRFELVGLPVPFPSANWLKERRPYLEVKIERAGGYWSVWFHGDLAGRMADDGIPKADEFRLSAIDGRARADTVILERLHPISK
jgi:serine/threonine protein kinase